VKTTSSLVKLLIFIAVTLLATGTLAATISNIQFGDKTKYSAIFTDVTGLNKGQEVRIAGVRVGTVDDIAVNTDRTTARVTFDVASTSVLTQGTEATVKWRNLVGERYIALSQGVGGAAPLAAGATSPLARTHPGLDLTVLFNGFKPLFAALSPADVNQLSGEIISVLQGEGGDINSLLAHTASLTSALADRDAVIGSTITNLTTVLDTVSANADSLGELLGQLQRFVSGLAADRTAIGQSLTNINSVAAQTASLLQQTRPDIKNDVAQLRSLATGLNTPANTKLFEKFMTTSPGKIAAITRTASYGSWFNFYLCRFDAKNIILPTGPLPGGLGYNIAAARCS
jgi:phospholipid/cholesterol/gamma-HCH transport system substrate-binding protein